MHDVETEGVQRRDRGVVAVQARGGREDDVVDEVG